MIFIKLLIITLILILTLTFSIQALEKDKLYHFGAGNFVYFMSEQLNFEKPIIMVIGVSLTKELHDYLSDSYSVKLMDIVVTITGGVFVKVVF
jgi:hypothetical protein